MPTDFYNQAAADLDEIVAELGMTFELNGVSYVGYYDRVSRGDTPTEGGAWDEYDGQLIVNRDTLPSIPVQGDKVTIDGETLWVQRVKSAPGLPTVTIQLSNNPVPR